MNAIVFLRANGIVALVGLCHLGFTHETAHGGKVSSFPIAMEVVEPHSQPTLEISGDHQVEIHPISESRVKASQAALLLSPGEEQRALLQRLEAQKSLRQLKAKKMAKHRRYGRRAWKREMENFLSAQKKIRLQRVQPKQKTWPLPENSAPNRSEDLKALPTTHSILA